MEFLIYLDVCCLNRPFDDQTQERIRLEAEAVLRILVKFQIGDRQLLGSEVFDDQLENTPEKTRKRQMKLWAALAISKVNITEQIECRGLELAELGFKDYDALHIACAEVGNADVFLTTDDRMLRLAARHSAMLYRFTLRLIQIDRRGQGAGSRGKENDLYHSFSEMVLQVRVENPLRWLLEVIND